MSEKRERDNTFIIFRATPEQRERLHAWAEMRGTTTASLARSMCMPFLTTDPPTVQPTPTQPAPPAKG